MGKIIDAHCHLEHLEASELSTFFSGFETNDMACVVASATERNNWDFYKKLEQEHPKQIKVCYGIHPLAIDEFWETDLNRLEQYLPQSIAVGEIGLRVQALDGLGHDVRRGMANDVRDLLLGQLGDGSVVIQGLHGIISSRMTRECR